MKKRFHNRGFSLIEVLVTLVLLTIGMLALVAMQGRGIQFTSDSVARNNGIMLATEVLETMRANPGARDEYLIEKLQADGECSGEAVEVSDVTEQMACWSEKARALMPGANGDGAEAIAVRNNFYICRSVELQECITNDGSAIEVQIAWRSNGERCREEEGEGDADPFICTLRLRGEL
ncbi:type IV pilus modification protein PilV [Pseudomonas sp. DNDY-54]|uniref:type IV pilus modification protein PilV n=1 Tax=Pseudomonas sp. DNDY-54 TaxID=2870860 RepID=UPI001CA3B247|nr:type IV pilus modification protein PilV [Pseudomonas sp. DNDY-54]